MNVFSINGFTSQQGSFPALTVPASKFHLVNEALNTMAENGDIQDYWLHRDDGDTVTFAVECDYPEVLEQLR